MKKSLFILAASLFSMSALFPLNVGAVSVDPDAGDYATDTTTTINIIAAPQGKENAVSINLVAEGMTILSYTRPSDENWIGPTSDCDNGETYSSTQVCASLAKPDPITAGESLGTISVQISANTYAKLTKTSENAYSDGASIRTDEGIILEFNKANKPQESTPSTGASSTSLQPLILVAALLIVAILIVLMLWPKIKNKFMKTKVDSTTSTPF